MKTKTVVFFPRQILANILIVAGVWLTGIEIGSWRFGGVGWAWGSTLGQVLLIAAAVLMLSKYSGRAEHRKRQ